MSIAIRALLIIAGAIHLLPVTGVLGAERLTALYGIDLASPDLQILLRHRAVLFGLLGAFLVGAAFRAAWRPAALIAGWISVASFLLLAWSVGGYGPGVARVVAADWVAAACLLGATFAEWRRRSAAPPAAGPR